MTAYRKEPEIRKTDSSSSQMKPDDDPLSCFWLPPIIVISYFVLSAIFRVTSNSGTKLDQIICYGTLICFVMIMLLGARNMYQDRKAMEAEKKRWAKGCTTALLTIAGRQEAFTWWDDYYDRGRSAPNSLRLEMNSEQRAVSPYDTIVQVDVSQYIYDRLEERNTVRIYYMPESPLTFLLEGEF